jgi:hypothetical protein|tara:strand:+ start:4801 stop:5625 length:825 start_codon:yes stop_codon:yes gene_type:complete
MSEENTNVEEVVNATPETPTTSVNDWRSSLPDDLKSDAQLERIKDVPTLAKSYIHAQRMVGAEKIAIPSKTATDDDWGVVYSRLGRPDDPTGYDIKADGQIITEDNVSSIKDTFHKIGLNNNQAEKLLDWYGGTIKSSLEAQQQNGELEAAAQIDNAEKALRQEWGKAYDQRLSTANTMAEKFGFSELLEQADSNGQKLGNNPNFIKAIYNISEAVGEHGNVGQTKNEIMTPAQATLEINSLRASEAYRNARHPEHNNAVQQMTKLYELRDGNS